MSKLIETLTRPSGFGRYLSIALALGLGLSSSGLLLLGNVWFSNVGGGQSAFQGILLTLLLVVIIALCSSCIWLIERLLRHLRLANRELESCCNIYPEPPIANPPKKDESDAASTYYTLTIQDLYNNAPCGYHSIDSNGRVVLMNDTELRMLGYDRAKVVGVKLFFEFVAPESVGLWMDQFEVLKIQGWVNNLEINLIHRDGRRFPVLVNSTAVWDQEGNYKMSRSTVVDVSQHKRTEHALRQSEAQYRGIVEDQTELICRFLPDGQLTFVNQAYCRYFGIKAEELVGRTFTPSIPEDDRAYVQDQFLQLCPEQPMVQYEHRVILPNGEIRWQAWTDRAMFDEYGVLVEYQGVGRDISEQYLHAAAVKKLSKALEMAVVGIAEVSPDGHYVQVNAAYGEMCGYDP
ncbi:MAG: PAS domain S-box protein, partial [Alkalinema sp. FL-bin-369]|nr:PAS domain S-box protein [Leptolyngbyaceae cyanobacterium LF-bin-369]